MDIISLPFELLKGQKIERYRLAIIASQRARALVDGARPYIETKNINHLIGRTQIIVVKK